MKRIAFVVGALFALTLVCQIGGTAHAAGASSISVSPSAADVGSKITVSGQGYPPNTKLVIKWDTVNASYIDGGNPSQVTGLSAIPWERPLASVETDGQGSFSTGVTLPQDYGSYYKVQAFATNGTALPGKAFFTLNTSFSISKSSGPAGTPVVVTTYGLGTSDYTFCYFLYWDNHMVGYYTAISTRGTANFTIYATGTPGTHLIQAYGAYPGPGYLNPQQSPYPTPVFTSEFNITSGGSGGGSGLSGSTVIGSLAIVAAVLAAGGLAVSFGRVDPDRRRAFAKGLSAAMIVIAIVVAGIAGYLAFAPTSSSPNVVFAPQATVDRPLITAPQNNATAGPRISVSPDVASVGQNVTVDGAGFPANQQEALSWSTRKGNNLLGYGLVAEPLRTVTTGSAGSFSFTMKVPADLGGLHYISVGNLTEDSNGTLFLQRTASINATQGPAGTVVAITMYGVGWTFNTNIAALDYDNSYIGFGCGFNSGGNVTFYLTVSGAPGLHTIDVYPAVWWGNSTPSNKLPVEYDFPLLTPVDHPALMPAFHFTFLITGTGQKSFSGDSILPALGAPIMVTAAAGSASLRTRTAGGLRRFTVPGPLAVEVVQSG
ncbi:MAG TPA: hypothetical protein VLY21_06595 [Nitrososphaerales archaeon]|nr:hypothetical protein [Nitrososphaerales archaeon]